VRGLPTKKKAKGTRLQDLSGKWKITEMPDLTEDYLAESKDPHMVLTFRGRGKNVRGHFEYGLSDGELDGEVIQVEGRPLEIRFSFEGSDEMDEVNGYGEAVLSDDNKTLTGKLHYHLGDAWRFTCRRR
jgi:hypothetical protein